MSHHTGFHKSHPVPGHGTAWDIGSFLRYEHVRADVVETSCGWQGDVPRTTIDIVLRVLQGDYPEEVFLAELPAASRWTRKLKLFVPGQEGCIITVIGGGVPRLMLGDDIAYLLPIPRAKRRSTSYRYFVDDGSVSREALTFDEVQGGLSSSLADHTHKRMLQASALAASPVAVPTFFARGQFKIPRWDGAFLVYREMLNHRPRYYLLPDNRRRKFNGRRGVEVFRAGVRNLFQVLGQINKHDDGMFHGDLIHRIHGGSANVGFTEDGMAVIKGWGRRTEEQLGEWPSKDRRRHQRQEVIGALAGLIQDIDLSGTGRQEGQRLLVDVVWMGLEAYLDRQGMVDRVSLASGLPSDVDRFVRSTQIFLSDRGVSDDLTTATFYQEAGQLEDEIKRWLVECVTRYL